MTDSNSNRFVRSHLKTRHLVLLTELGRHRSIAHAAEAANLTQPAASKLLSELEHALGVQLFERLSRGVEPTWYGEILIRRAGAALAEMDAAHQEVMELLSGLSGKVNLGSVLTPATRLVPEAVNLLKQKYPKVNVAISLDTSKVLIERLRSGELDLVIGRILDAKSAAEMNFEPLTDEPHSLIARTGHPLANHPNLQLQDLVHQAWILPPSGSILRDRLTALFLAHGLDQPVETVETLAPSLVINMLTGSNMIVALPEELVQPYLDLGLLVVLPFTLAVRMDMYGIVTRKGHQLSPGAAAMLAALRDAAGLPPSA
ncbi:MAG TPA: LysR substrate-binding domain-containing protein [Burkholderiaceae bacterium]